MFRPVVTIIRSLSFETPSVHCLKFDKSVDGSYEYLRTFMVNLVINVIVTFVCEIWCWRRLEEISWTDRVKNKGSITYGQGAEKYRTCNGKEEFLLDWSHLG